MEDPAFEQLISRRLIIRRFALADAETFASYRSDAAVAQFQGWECPYRLSDARQFIASLHDISPGIPGTWYQFAVSLASTGALIGDAALCATRADASQAELGFTVASAYQGKGYASEAVAAVMQYGFETLKLRRFFSRTDSRNLRAQRLLERLGFRRQDEFGERSWFKGTWVTDFLYAQLAAEWPPRDPSSGVT